MHYLFFVTFDKKKARNKEEAREYVLQHINDDGIGIDSSNFKVRPDLFWTTVDRVRVGGRWSGLLFGEDVSLLTASLYRKWLEPLELRLRGGHAGTTAHVSLEGESLCPYFIGQKWLVVIDGHLTDYVTVNVNRFPVSRA